MVVQDNTMSEELSIETVPRDPRALLSLDTKQRKKLFKQLCEAAEQRLEPGIRAFSDLHPMQQMHCLLSHLIEYDKATAGYTVMSVALPVRSTRAATNQKRMDEFAEAFEDKLNKLRETGHGNITTFCFEGQGIVMSGYKPPPSVEVLPFPVPQAQERMPVPHMPPELQKMLESNVGTQHIEKLAGLLFNKKNLQRMVTQEDVDKIVEEETKRFDAETLSAILSGLEDRMKEHLKAHDDGSECEVVAELKKLHVAVAKRLRTQLS